MYSENITSGKKRLPPARGKWLVLTQENIERRPPPLPKHVETVGCGEGGVGAARGSSWFGKKG